MSIFHRYKSTIHGNYRQAYLRCGLITGFLLAAYLLVRLLMGSPLPSPASLISDIILLVAVFLFTAYYRNSLPDRKITLKEAMLFGVGLSLVAGLLYALLLFAIGTAFPLQIDTFTATLGNEQPSQYPLYYWAILWAFLAAVQTILLGSFGAFLAAILFRNEKSQQINRKKQ